MKLLFSGLNSGQGGITNILLFDIAYRLGIHEIDSFG